MRVAPPPSPQAARDKADSSDPGSVGAPMAGEIIEVKAKPGSYVKAGQVGGCSTELLCRLALSFAW